MIAKTSLKEMVLPGDLLKCGIKICNIQKAYILHILQTIIYP